MPPRDDGVTPPPHQGTNPFLREGAPRLESRPAVLALALPRARRMPAADVALFNGNCIHNLTTIPRHTTVKDPIDLRYKFLLQLPK